MLQQAANKQLAVGVYLDAESQIEHLQETISSLLENTSVGMTLHILSDIKKETVIARYPSIPLACFTRARGAATCFNALCTHTRAAYYAFIECGAIIGPGCLDKMLHALERTNDYGVAGPSTNHCWNEQEIIVDDSCNNIKGTADIVAQMFGGEVEDMSPLHSLGAFCYMVKHEVIQAVGVANEAFGTGPCWEVEYTTRAAGMGYRSIWVKGAYTGRAQVSGARQKGEQTLRLAKQYYQDLFCRLRSTEHGTPYCEHCMGDECSHFVTTPLQSIAAARVSDRETHWHLPARESAPLVSCVMPTCRRAHWVATAIRQFHQQNYPNKELIIVYEEESDVLPYCHHRAIRYVQAEVGSHIGRKRQLGTQAAGGDIIAQWDDDDWYATNRLMRQVEPIILGVADITGLTNTLFFDLDAWRFWRCRRSLYSQLFYQQVAGGTLVFRKKVWQKVGGYRNISLREDAEFLRSVLQSGARLSRIEGEALFLYLRHGKNSWDFQVGRECSLHEWSEVDEPDIFHLHRSVYLKQQSRMKRSGVLPVHNTVKMGKHPLVSCIMPTANRRRFISRAIQLFQQQDYPALELIIVDDGHDAVCDLVPSDPRIRYVHNTERSTIGSKRNQACEMARGEIIVHWDDDDWMAPCWVRRQVSELQLHQADICGLSELLFYEPTSGNAWQYRYDGDRQWVCGGTLCYTREFWRQNPFPDINVGEDNAFIWSGVAKKVMNHKGSEAYVATIHKNNTCAKNTRDRRWRRYPPEKIALIMGNYFPLVTEAI